MAETSERLSIKEKIGYGLGDTAANFIYQTMVVFQLAFYTDTFGITAAAAGTLFIVVRVWDAIFDPIMGIVADRTNTRWGKFRPWILWTAVPFGLVGTAAFITPDFGPSGKLIYAYASYIVLMMVYSANNLPYSALTGVITGDLSERSSLSQYRFVLAMMAAFIVQGLSLPMVRYFGQGNNAKGYQITMAILSTLAVVCFFVTFFTIKERIRPDPAQKTNIRQDFSDLGKNGPWVALFLLTIFNLISYTIRAGVMVYYFKYYVGREDLFSIYNVCGLAACVAGIVISKPLSLRYGKREVFGVGLILTVIFQSAFAFLPAAAGPAIAFELLRQICYGCTIPLMWTMMADVADYSEWKTGRRATGMVYAGIVFGLKFGLGVGGAIAGWLLSLYGYVPNAVQSAHALTGIRLTASVFGAIPFLLAMCCLFFYGIDTKLNIRITNELAERRQKFASPATAS